LALLPAADGVDPQVLLPAPTAAPLKASERRCGRCLCCAYATSAPRGSAPPHTTALGLDVALAFAGGAPWGSAPHLRRQQP